MTDEEIVKQAQQRAVITGYLHQNPGERTIADVVGATGLSKYTVSHRLHEMADDGLIKAVGQNTGRRYLALPEGPQQPEQAQHEEVVMGEEKKTKKSAKVVRAKALKTPHPAPATAKDVELVINNTLIVLGRNPATGRLRITLEEQ
jgi:DNA-binding Lrp family transcriptional regulator